MPYIFGAIVFLFGAALGSFVSVVANRYNTGLPFLRGRSICFSCNIVLKNKDLFPIFSFLTLVGKCRYCGSKIPKETFIAEILMGVLSVLAAFKSGLFSLGFPLLLTTNYCLLFASYLLLTSIFAIILLISLYDLKHFIIPDSFLVAFFIFSLIYFLIPLSFKLQYFSLSVLSGIALTLPFVLIFIISKGQWIGFGDVKYIFVIGFFLGIAGGLSAVILAFWAGAAFSLLAIFFNKFKVSLPFLRNNLTIKSEIPFGPFLSLGIILSFYFNADLFQIQTLLSFF